MLDSIFITVEKSYEFHAMNIFYTFFVEFFFFAVFLNLLFKKKLSIHNFWKIIFLFIILIIIYFFYNIQSKISYNHRTDLITDIKINTEILSLIVAYLFTQSGNILFNISIFRKSDEVNEAKGK